MRPLCMTTTFLSLTGHECQLNIKSMWPLLIQCVQTPLLFFFKIPCWVRIRQDTLTKRPKIPLIFPDAFCCISASKTLPLLEYKYDFNNWVLLGSFKNTELLFVYFIFMTKIIVKRILSDAKTYEYIEVFMIAINQSWKAKLLKVFQVLMKTTT